MHPPATSVCRRYRSGYRKARAPSCIHFDISCIRSLPGGALRTSFAKIAATTRQKAEIPTTTMGIQVVIRYSFQCGIRVALGGLTNRPHYIYEYRNPQDVNRSHKAGRPDVMQEGV